MGVLDAGNHLHLFVDEMADVGVVVDVELDQQVVVAGGGIDLRGNLGFRERVGDGIGLAELAFELDEEGNHRVSPEIFAALIAFSGEVDTGSRKENASEQKAGYRV